MSLAEQASHATQSTSHPTLRALSGAPGRSQLPWGATALLVIDFQNEYFSGRLPIPRGPQVLEQAPAPAAVGRCRAGCRVPHPAHCP